MSSAISTALVKQSEEAEDSALERGTRKERCRGNSCQDFAASRLVWEHVRDFIILRGRNIGRHVSIISSPREAREHSRSAAVASVAMVALPLTRGLNHRPPEPPCFLVLHGWTVLRLSSIQPLAPVVSIIQSHGGFSWPPPRNSTTQSSSAAEKPANTWPGPSARRGSASSASKTSASAGPAPTSPAFRAKTSSTAPKSLRSSSAAPSSASSTATGTSIWPASTPAASKHGRWQPAGPPRQLRQEPR